MLSYLILLGLLAVNTAFLVYITYALCMMAKTVVVTLAKRSKR